MAEELSREIENLLNSELTKLIKIHGLEKIRRLIIEAHRFLCGGEGSGYTLLAYIWQFREPEKSLRTLFLRALAKAILKTDKITDMDLTGDEAVQALCEELFDESTHFLESEQRLRDFVRYANQFTQSYSAGTRRRN